MRAILVSPSDRAHLRTAGDRMPLGVLYISEALKENGIKNKVIDMNHVSWKDAINSVRLEKPDILGLSVMTPSYTQMHRFAQEVKGSVGKVIAGGFHVTHVPGSFDGLATEVSGYGENGLLNALESDSERVSGDFDINQFPIPNRNALDKSLYNFTLEGLPATTMMVQRGCPFTCGFCSNFDKTQKRRELENIAQELDELALDRYEAIYFLDDSFTLNRQFAKRVAEEVGKRGFKYRVQTRANLLDEEMAKVLSETGCITVGMGIESGDNIVLESAGKRQRIEDTTNSLRLLKRYGIRAKGHFIIGLPNETIHSAINTIQYADELRKESLLSSADFYSLVCFPGSPIYRSPEKYGIEILDSRPNKMYSGERKLRVTTQTERLKAPEIKRLIQLARDKWKS